MVALGASTSWEQAAGVCLVAGGIVLVRGVRAGTKPGLALGLAIGCCIAAYTLVDKYGIRYASPVSYLELTMVPAAIGYAAVVAPGKGLAALRAEASLAAVAAGLAMFGSYALVLAALQRAPAASVAAVRETSVIVATALAGLFLRERVGWVRMAGAAAVAAGIGLLSLA